MFDLAELPGHLLSMLPPWWWFVLYGGKRTENRCWKSLPSFKGRVWLHAGARFDVEEVRAALAGAPITTALPVIPSLEEMLVQPRGGIVGSAEIVAAVWNGRAPKDPWAQGAELFEPGTVWAKNGAVGLKLDDVRIADVFVPWKGMLGMPGVEPMQYVVAHAVARAGGVTTVKDVLRELGPSFGGRRVIAALAALVEVENLVEAAPGELHSRAAGGRAATRVARGRVVVEAGGAGELAAPEAPAPGSATQPGDMPERQLRWSGW
jgi:hypothetical protein